MAATAFCVLPSRGRCLLPGQLRMQQQQQQQFQSNSERID